jgi:hypothetical protein
VPGVQQCVAPAIDLHRQSGPSVYTEKQQTKCVVTAANSVQLFECQQSNSVTHHPEATATTEVNLTVVLALQSSLLNFLQAQHERTSACWMLPSRIAA